MRRLTEEAHEIVRDVLHPGETAVDATAGNGYDTLFLARTVGPEGTVFAFDVQRDALRRTARRLDEAGMQNVVLLQRDHATLASSMPRQDHGRVGAVMFNLGYLPGGDKSLTTCIETTRAAIQAVPRLLRSGAVLTVVAYPGHPGGLGESHVVAQLLADLPSDGFEIREFAAGQEASAAPRLFAVRKK